MTRLKNTIQYWSENVNQQSLKIDLTSEQLAIVFLEMMAISAKSIYFGKLLYPLMVPLLAVSSFNGFLLFVFFFVHLGL